MKIYLLQLSINKRPKDSDKSCRDVLIAQCEDDDQHVGGDILDHLHWRDAPQHISAWLVLQKITSFFTTPLLPYMWCYKHQQYCLFKQCDIDNSGFPCVDYSPAGSQLGVYGPTFNVLLALLAWHRGRQTKIVFLENVTEFPIEIIRFLMEDMFHVEEFYVQPADAGCEYLSRMRVFILLTLRGWDLF